MPPLNKSGTDAASEQPRAQTPVTDPVCGMKVDPATARHSYVHDGVTYYFCSDGCRAKFAAAPTKYLAGAMANAPAAGVAPAEGRPAAGRADPRRRPPDAGPAAGAAPAAGGAPPPPPPQHAGPPSAAAHRAAA